MEEHDTVPTGAMLTLLGSSGAAISLFLDTRPNLIAKGILANLGVEQDITRTLSLEVPSDWLSQITRSVPAPSEWHEGEFTVEISEIPLLGVEVHYVNADSKLWAGQVHNQSSDERIHFSFQELHSPDVTVVIVTILGLLCGISVLADLLRGCEKKAEEACGAGNVKSVRTKKSWAGIANCSMECEFECKN